MNYDIKWKTYFYSEYARGAKCKKFLTYRKNSGPTGVAKIIGYMTVQFPLPKIDRKLPDRIPKKRNPRAR